MAEAQRGDWPMWGGSPDRNMVSGETNIPAEWDLPSGKNVKWTARLGSVAYGSPVIAGGKIFVGTNNNGHRRPGIEGDRGVLMCFEEQSGKFLWQATHDKLPTGQANDWPEQGIASVPVVQGHRLYYVSNRCELVCADTEGFLDGQNDGPLKHEQHRAEQDADFIWIYDMIGRLGVFPHNLAASSPVIGGELVFAGTSNGADETHLRLPAPQAPSFIAVHKNTGRLVWQSNLPGDRILHGQWSSPAYGVIGGKPQVVFGGGDGWAYGLEAATGKLLWKFDLNPKDSVWKIGGRGTRNSIVATPVIQDDKVYLAVGQDPEHGDGVGHLYCIDATCTGDITRSGRVWHYGGDDFQRTLSTAAIADGLLYLSTLSGYLHCLDAETGRRHWVHDTYAAVWGSPAVIDGKVFLGNEDGDVVVLEHGPKLRVIATNDTRNSVYTTPVASNGVLYIANRNTLMAIRKREGRRDFVAPGPEGSSATTPARSGNGTEDRPRPKDGPADWPMFRGNPSLTGVAHDVLPDRPQLLWRTVIGEMITSSAAIVDGTVYLGNEQGGLYALALADGAVRWKHSVKAPIRSSPCVYRGMVFFGDDDGRMHALEAPTGKVAWSFAAQAQIVSSPNCVGDRVVFGSYDGCLYCLSSQDGSLLWKYQAQDRIHGTPGIRAGRVMVAGCDGMLRVIDLQQGTQLRAVNLGAYCGASAAGSGSRVFLGTMSDRVLGIDWTTGTLLWTYQNPDRQFPFLSSAAVIDRTVVLGGRDKLVHALDADTGKLRWKFRTRGRVESSPVIVGDRVFVGSSDGNLYALSLEHGKELWRFVAGAPLSASPAVAGGRLVIGSEDGVVYCFGPAPSPRPGKQEPK